MALQFTPSHIPYISGLRGRYKSYMLATALKMRTTVGIQLYELCLRWGFCSEVEMGIDGVRERLGVAGKYPHVKDLRVLQPAIEDVQRATDLRIEFRPRKTGRRMTHFQFRITAGAALRLLDRAQGATCADHGGRPWGRGGARCSAPTFRRTLGALPSQSRRGAGRF